jgi:hypothetical protein
MSRMITRIIATALIAAASLVWTDAGSAKPSASRHSAQQQKHRPLRSAPVYLEQGQSRPLKWGDPGFYEGWTPPPARGGGVG